MKIIRSNGAKTGLSERVFLAIPAYDTISCETAVSLIAAKEVLLRNDIESEVAFCAENCHVDDGRNYLVRLFLESQCNQLVFIDADVRFDPEDLVRLVKYSQDVVCGVYPKKKDEQEYPVEFFSGDIRWNEDGLIPVRMVPTGFLKIRRDVFEVLYENVGKYIPQREIGKHSLMIPEIFERKTHGSVRLGGDYEFCDKWSKCGGELFVDPLMLFGHVGRKEYGGILGTYLIKKNGLSDDYTIAIIDKIKTREGTPRDYVVLHDIWDNKWTPPVDMLMAIFETACNCSGNIVEIGSGLTTLLFGATGRKVVSIEHDKTWFDKMSSIKNKCGLDNVDIVHSEIKNGWYNIDINDENVSLVLIDGPPRKKGDRRLVTDHLINISEDCVFIVDDCDSGLDITTELDEKFGVNFKNFGRYAIGVRKND